MPEYANQQLLDGTTAGSVDRYDTSSVLYRHISELAALRASSKALTDGAQIERYAKDDVYAFSRVDATEKIEHLVALNNGTSPATVTVDTLTPGATFAPLYGTSTSVTAGADGNVTVTVPALGAIVLKAGSTVGSPTSAGAISLSAPAAGSGLTGLAPVTADVATDVWSQTSFAYRVLGDDTWTPLGTSESTTPRVYADVSGLPAGALVEYRAVTVDAAGHTSAASTFASVGNAVDGVVPPTAPGDLHVTIPGSHNSEMGCPGDWQPDCAAATLTKRADGVYSGTFTLPAGSYEYKVAINGSWDENYGAGGVAGGANVAYTVTTGGPVTFYYDATTHWFTSTAQGPILTVPGSDNSELGCAGDWAPDCMATWLEDPDGDGTYTFVAPDLPAGGYEVKVAHNLGWDENYGAGGAPGGANIPFTAPGGKPVTFSYVLATHVLTIQVTDPPLPGTGEERAQWIDGSTIAWPAEWVPSGTDPTSLTWQLHGSPDKQPVVADGAVTGDDGAPVTLSYVAAGLSDAQKARFPALATGYLALHVEASTQRVQDLLRGALLVTQASGDTLQAATGVQIPGVLDDVYAKAAKRALGTTWSRGVPSLALWAPTAQSVDLLVWNGTDPTRVAAHREKDGSWTVGGKKSWTGKQFLWEVTVYAPTTDKVEVNQVTDPYSVALTVNSTRSVLVDLADKAFRPRQWEKAKQPVVRPVDQTIYELHVRDFSISDPTVPAAQRGTYLAFAGNGAGRQHLRTLEKAGLTTIHLLPTFDIASIQEDRTQQTTPACDLASFPPTPTSSRPASAPRRRRTASTGATTRCTGRRRRARTRSTRTAAAAWPTSARWSARCTPTVCRWCSTRCSTTPPRAGRLRSRSSTAWCPATTSGCPRRARSRPRRAARTWRPSTPWRRSSWSTRWSPGHATTRSTASGSTSWGTTRWTP